MTSPTKKILWHNAPLKVISLILGYTFWYIFGHSHVTTAWVTVPLYFYNVPPATTIKAPETLFIKIAGKRSELRALDFEHLAIHIDAQTLQEGPNRLAISDARLFLPDTIKLIHYSPSNPTAEVTTEHQ